MAPGWGSDLFGAGRVVQDATLAPAMFEGADDQPISIMSKTDRAEKWLPDSRRGNLGLFPAGRKPNPPPHSLRHFRRQNRHCSSLTNEPGYKRHRQANHPEGSS